MFTEGIYPIGDGLLDIDENRLKGLLVSDDINEIYEVEQTPFARGKFAAVRRAIHKNSGVHFAAKFLKRRRRAQSSDKEIKHEIAVLMLCDGAENIVKLNAVHESRSDTALLLELATGGELQTFLDNEECLNEAQARVCMREVLKALQFLHKRSIVHLDLKPQNILLIGEHIEDGLKLCDFGISRVVTEGTNVREIVGTPDYVAPEVLQYEPLSLSTDIWSVGVLAYVLLSGFSPFGGETKQETFLNISQCALTFPDKLFGGVSAAAIDFMRRALRIKPSDRMTAAGCLEHHWLKDECSIDRQLFGNLTKATTADADTEDDQDESIEEDFDDSDNKAHINGTQMDASSEENLMSNGKTHNFAATAVLTMPATRATTIPICVQKQQLHIARRHSSDSNKENTFLATKNIMPTTSTSTATIIITSTANATPATTTITLPNGNACNEKNAAPSHCLFPDAPTTPKVIRKAPTTEASPTSVKALVKKFQLEGKQQMVLDPAAVASSKCQDKCLLNDASQKLNHSLSNGSSSSTSSLQKQNNNSRRASEPIAAVHKQSASSPTCTQIATAVSTAAGSPTSYKTTCVYCLTCGNKATTGCRHSAASATSPSSTQSSHSSSSTSTAMLFHHHQQPAHLHHHHHHHHHHHAVAKSAANNLSLDQGIIC